MRNNRGLPWALVGILVALACSSVPGAAPGPGDGPGTLAAQESPGDTLIPAGYGTLRQDQVTLQLRRGALQVKATPLREWLIRLLAPDTYDRLSALKRTHGAVLQSQVMVAEPLFVLVQLFTNEQAVPFQPEDVLLVNQGLKYRPLAIQPITPGWGTQRLNQQETQLALYAFDPTIDLEVDLALEYKEIAVSGWAQLLPVLQAEEAKIRARAGSGPGGEDR